MIGTFMKYTAASCFVLYPSLLACLFFVGFPAHASVLYPASQQLVVDDAAADDGLGPALRVDGDTLLVGADGNDDSGADSGSVYVFDRVPGEGFSQSALLLPSNAGDGALVGSSLSLQGDRALLGGYRSDLVGAQGGAAWIFERDLSGQWSESATLSADDGMAGDFFGIATALAGDQALVGAIGHDSAGPAAGRLYVFERGLMGSWSQVDSIVASDTVAGHFFGSAIAVDGDRALVAAEDSDDNGPSSGSAYVFERDGMGNWTEQAKLVASNGASGDRFGHSVTLQGDTAVVGAIFVGEPDVGAVYVFEKQPDDSWVETDILVAADAGPIDGFGRSVAMSGNRIVVGADRDDDGGMDAGAVYLFAKDAVGAWYEAAKFTAASSWDWDWFGFSVALDGDTMAAGAPLANGILADTGAVWVANVTVPLCGDPAGDGQVGASDALFVLRAAVGLNSCAAESCDMSGDGQVMAGDALALLQVAVGMDVTLACDAAGY